MAFGLTSRQVKIYLALVQLQESSARDLASQVGMPRLTAYSILERLNQMGLVGYYEKRHARIYRANPPDALVRFCEEETLRIESKRERILHSLPQLQSFYQNSLWVTLPGSQDCRTFYDSAEFERSCSLRLKSGREWWAVHSGPLWPLLRRLRSSSAVAPRCLLPSGSPLPAQRELFSVCVLPKAFWKNDMRLLILEDSLFFVFAHEGFFSAFELRHGFTARQMSGILQLLWESRSL